MAMTTEEKELIELFFKDNTPVNVIANELGRSPQTVYSYLEKAGLRKIEHQEEETKEEQNEQQNPKPQREKVRNLHINRGEIYYIVKEPGRTPQEQESGRPAIIVSNNKCNLFSDYVEVVFLTTQAKKGLPTHAKVFSTGKESTALCERIQSIPKYRVAEYVCMCTDEEMRSVNAALADSIGLNLNTPPAQTEATSEQQIVANDTAYQTALAERDAYKKLYDELLEKIIKSR